MREVLSLTTLKFSYFILGKHFSSSVIMGNTSNTSWATLHSEQSQSHKNRPKCQIGRSKISSCTNVASMTNLQHTVWLKQRMNANIGMQKCFTFTTIHQRWGADYFLRSMKEKQATHRQYIVSTNVMNQPQIGMSTSSVSAVATPTCRMSPLILTPLLKSLRRRNLRPLPPIKRRNLDIPANHVPHMSAASKKAGRRRGGWQKIWVW